MRLRHSVAKYLAVVLASAIVAAGIGELYCRARSLPFSALVLHAIGSTPQIFDADAELGWRLRPGSYRTFAGDKTVTILRDGSRATGSPEKPAPDLALLGCSYTLGWGLSDDETFAWKLHERFPG